MEDERLTDDAARRETLYLGLRRREGVRRADFERAFGAAPEAFYRAELADLYARDLLCDSAGSIRLTERGLLFADDVFLALLPG